MTNSRGSSAMFRAKSESVTMLSAEDVDKIVTDVVSPPLTSCGFERIDRRKWVRSKKPQIREMISLGTMKGLRLSACWGFSVDFVPHVAAGRIRWHRTPRTARFDLVYDPYDYKSAEQLTISRFPPSLTKAREAAKALMENAAQVHDNCVHKLTSRYRAGRIECLHSTFLPVRRVGCPRLFGRPVAKSCRTKELFSFAASQILPARQVCWRFSLQDA